MTRAGLTTCDPLGSFLDHSPAEIVPTRRGRGHTTCEATRGQSSRSREELQVGNTLRTDHVDHDSSVRGESLDGHVGWRRDPVNLPGKRNTNWLSRNRKRNRRRTPERAHRKGPCFDVCPTEELESEDDARNDHEQN